MEEVYGAAGYRDGGMRFIKKGPPKPNPQGDLEQQKLLAEIKSLNARGKSALMTGLAALAKVDLGDRELEADNANSLMERLMRAHDMGHQHADLFHKNVLAAKEHGHRHGLAIAGHRQTVIRDAQQQAANAAGPDEDDDAGDAGAQQQAAAPPLQPAQQPSDLDQKLDVVLQLLQALLARSGGFPTNPYGGPRQ